MIFWIETYFPASPSRIPPTGRTNSKLSGRPGPRENSTWKLKQSSKIRCDFNLDYICKWEFKNTLLWITKHLKNNLYFSTTIFKLKFNARNQLETWTNLKQENRAYQICIAFGKLCCIEQKKSPTFALSSHEIKVGRILGEKIRSTSGFKQNLFKI